MTTARKTRKMPGLSEREIGTLLERFDQLDSKVDKLTAAVNGTGKPGLTQQLNDALQRVADLEQWQTRTNRLLVALGIPLLVGVLAFIGGFGWGVMTHQIEILFH